MFSRTARIYKSKDDNGKFVFPEQVYGKVNKNKAGLALSGGGSRAFMTAMATIKFLTDKNLIDEISYISTISGSNWFIAPYIYADVNMGIYRKPKNITMDNLRNDNHNFMEDTALSSIVNLDIYNRLKEAKKNGIVSEELWNYICGMNFLESYGINNKCIVENEERANFYKTNNFMDCIYPKEGRPFWLSNATIRGDNGPVYITSCCMYSGVQSRIKVDGEFIGGYLIESPCLDSKNPDIKMEDYMEDVDVEINEPFTLNDIIGTSSAAFSGYLDEYKRKIKAVTFNKLIVSGEFNPTYRIWDIERNTDKVLSAVDGYMVDNTGMIALLARGCDRIMVMSANQEIDGEDYFNSNILSLFGKWNEYGGYECDPNISDTCKVFKEEDFDTFLSQLREKKSSGGPVYVRMSLEVLENKRLSIKGGFTVDLLMYFIYPCTDYINQLSSEIRDQMNPGGELERFPNYKTILQNKGALGMYTRAQCNSLLYYIQWLLIKTKKEILDFI